MIKIQKLEQIESKDNTFDPLTVMSHSAKGDDIPIASSPSYQSPKVLRKPTTNASPKSLSQGSSPAGRQHSFMGSPDKVRGNNQDLFELLEKVQCSRLEDQRCELPAYFAQLIFNLF
uniref:Uncharacterized protein n=1 Tax=Glossina brevipalpis TaxID=37001 RepID=A0A1A9WKX8_9MUSC